MIFANKNTVEIGGEKVVVKPITLDSAVRIALLMSPILPYIENHKHEFSQALVTNRKPDVLSAMFQALSDELLPHVGVMSQVVALMVGVDPNEFASRVTAEELVAMLPTLNRVHNIPRLYVAVLGLLGALEEGNDER